MILIVFIDFTSDNFACKISMLNLSCKSVEDNFMLIDLHCHEKTNSPCSNASLSEIAVEAQRKGLDAVCITDHDSLGLRESAHTFSKTIHYPIMVGTEIYTFEGDLIVFGLEHVPTRRPHLLELLELVCSVHGVCFSAHPYRSNQRGLRSFVSVLKDYKDIVGIEIRNGRTDSTANQTAELRCRELGLFAVGGSDGHEATEVGCCATWLPGQVHDEAALVKALRSGTSKAAVYQNGHYKLVETS